MSISETGYFFPEMAIEFLKVTTKFPEIWSPIKITNFPEMVQNYL